MIGANRILLGRCVFSLHIAPTYWLLPSWNSIIPLCVYSSCVSNWCKQWPVCVCVFVCLLT
jgi:hypothetical protein